LVRRFGQRARFHQILIGLGHVTGPGNRGDSISGAISKSPETIARCGRHDPCFIWCHPWCEPFSGRWSAAWIEGINWKKTSMPNLAGEWHATDHEGCGGRNIWHQAFLALHVNRLLERCHQPTVGPHEPTAGPLETLSISAGQLQS
jgi:hypothetical protein